ncbi:uncharacterized protein N7459_002194 [Penicillium hispanicum]|uniref:uncharacterized protein n=1 Tax=Penicillium hispanicum TaxID=1080232 RepID=UPI0025417484|nr:uncharacterized protein N7459_002194 [Penicillium hispanicum]KAJ5591825.1 hypothetical protein N7459_002194 [Penicillium hispanicum]
MRYHAVALLAGASAATAGNTATLLLPGFEHHALQAGVLGSSGDATTYLLTCPTTVAATSCGSMTAIAAPTSAELINVGSDGQPATLACNVAGTTYASCKAHWGTKVTQNTLAPKDLNWMPVPVTGLCSTSTLTPTSTATPTHTSTASIVTPTSTWTPTSKVTPSPKSSTPVSSPKKSISRPASSTTVVTSSVAVTATTSAVSSTSETTQSASSTPSTTANAAAPLAGNAWTLGGAVLALLYALA